MQCNTTPSTQNLNNSINEKADIWVSRNYLHVYMYMYYLLEMHEFIGESMAIHVHIKYLHNAWHK